MLRQQKSKEIIKADTTRDLEKLRPSLEDSKVAEMSLSRGQPRGQRRWMWCREGLRGRQEKACPWSALSSSPGGSPPIAPLSHPDLLRRTSQKPASQAHDAKKTSFEARVSFPSLSPLASGTTTDGGPFQCFPNPRRLSLRIQDEGNVLRKEGREAGGLLKPQCESDTEKNSMEGFQDSLPSLPQRSLELGGSGPAAQDARKTSVIENAPKHAGTVH